MFVNLLEPPRHTRLVDATHMIGAQRLVAQGWTVCNSYLDGYTGEPTVEGRAAFAAEVERAVSSLPERCVVLTAGIPLQQRDPRRFVCHNSAVCGTGAKGERGQVHISRNVSFTYDIAGHQISRTDARRQVGLACRCGVRSLGRASRLKV